MARNRFIDDEKTEETFDGKLILRLFSYLKPYKKQVAVTLFLTLISTGIGLLIPFLLKVTIDTFIERENMAGLIWMGLCLVVIHIASLYCMRYRIQIMSVTAKRILMDLRQELFDHIQTLSLPFFDNRPVGKILARVIGDVNSLHDLFNNSVTNLLPDFMTLVCVIIIMLSMNLRLALVSLLILPFLLVGMFLVEIVSRKRWQLVRKKSSNLNAYIHESFSGIRVIQAYVQERETGNIFIDLVHNLRSTWLSAIRVSNAFWPMVDLSWGLGSVLVYWFGIKLLNTTEITVGTLIAFSSYIGMFWQPIANLSNFYNTVITSMTAAERIFEVMDTKPEIQDKPDAVPLPPIKGEVVFDGVCFGYEENQQVLGNVSFKVKPGEMIALVGPTGAGKTTIVNLISRFYEPQKGRVLIDGYDIRDVTLHSLRSQMGIMLQDTFLFSDSIMENIRYGRLDATDEEVIEAAKAVHAHDFIMSLENGYETQVNERGSRLSVGQRQLISFARALLADPKILILDEATSSIDTHTEQLVQNALKTLLQGRTSFVIAHRLSTIRNADRIMVIDHKGIVEEGNHRQLMERKGMYYELCKAQYRYVHGEDEVLVQ